MKQVSKKVVMLGDFSVGKTSLIRRFVENAFSDEYLTTIGVKISRKNIPLPEHDIVVQLLIWDIEGQTQIKAIPSHYLVGAAGGIVVADSTRPETLATLGGHIEHFRQINPAGPLLVALNKCDLQPLESEAFARMRASHAGVRRWFATSAKSGENVDMLFAELAKAVWAI